MAFASNFVVEIFKETSGEYSSRLTFNDKYYGVCNGDFIDKASFRYNASSFLEVLNKSNEGLDKYCPDTSIKKEEKSKKQHKKPEPLNVEARWGKLFSVPMLHITVPEQYVKDMLEITDKITINDLTP